jgi:hypothetical protein
MNNERVTYIPPSQKQIEQFAQEVCQTLAQAGDEIYLQPEVISGFADFLGFAAELLAKSLSKGHDELLDKHNA